MELKVQLKRKKEKRLTRDVLFVILPTLKALVLLLCIFLILQKWKSFVIIFLCWIFFFWLESNMEKKDNL